MSKKGQSPPEAELQILSDDVQAMIGPTVELGSGDALAPPELAGELSRSVREPDPAAWLGSMVSVQHVRNG